MTYDQASDSGRPPTRTSPLLRQVLSVSGDPTGTDTFARFIWQAKQAVYHWLSCLSAQDSPCAIICEHVEDLVIVYANRVRFAQLKTRTKGSWSSADVCSSGKGIDSLIRSYALAKQHGLIPVSSFELWLEGPSSDQTKTVTFFTDPSKADTEIKRKIRDLGMPQKDIGSFLKRLTIHSDQPSRTHIDAVIGQLVGAIWPSLSSPERNSLYVQLLGFAETAQRAAAQPDAVRRMLAQGQSDGLTNFDPLFSTGIDARMTADAAQAEKQSIQQQVLTREALRSITPALPSDSREDLLKRLQSGQYTSALELKMLARGAKKETIARAQSLRADGEVQRQMLIASGSATTSELRRMNERLLIFAEAISERARQQAVSNPSISFREAEYIASELLGRPADLSNLDIDQLFSGDPYLAYGQLCQLSDECRFWWGLDDAS